MQRLQELEGQAYAPSTSNLSGVPSGCFSYDNKVETVVAKIVELKDLIKEKRRRCLIERNRLEQYISNIPDSLTRQIFTLRFVEGLSWFKVAQALGGNNTEDTVRQICSRYIREKCQ